MAKTLDQHLRVAEITDFPGALNGLQLENSGEVTRLGAAVDACEAVLAQAIQKGIDLLIVHHGLYWQGNQRIVGPFYRKLKRAMDADLAVYSAHLPLDIHPQLGNAAILSQAIAFRRATRNPSSLGKISISA